ncbi:DNA repair protein RecN [Sporosarcina sp. NCCP-2716]|uniref:DNA repair protein RecN n=1 Tax=Sporosarcina sp. NCCP-2716 TaxID=2943679 RepID=UPI00203E2B1D|nr:DNA repair protein RecN [Sporosarcina sp. NCCP-2716]GKV68125.1 DNA repair protein RecN [Sporosarcina sp. NCCP-2716]
MLSELSIKNFAIIEELHVSFEEGLTVLTGETGAGKSIIIDAVQLVAGGRGSVEFIRHGTKKAELEAMFVIPSDDHPVFSKLAEFGIDSEDGTIILQRELNQSGKTTCRVNGKLVTIAILRELGSQLIDIHGQHENQELMHQKQHIHLLDAFAGEPFKGAMKSYAGLYEDYVKLRKKLSLASENEQQIAQRIDLYSFQLRELDEAALQDGEEESLEGERLKLQHFNRLFDRLNNAYDALQGDSHALDFLGNAMSDLEDAATVDKDLTTLAESAGESFYTLQDVAHDIKGMIDEMEFDPMRLEAVEDRLALITSLKRKYGASIDEILQYRDKIADRLDELVNRDGRLEKEQQRLEHLRADLEIEAGELSEIRKQSAGMLESAIMEQLRQLHMEKAVFEVRIDRKEAGVFDYNGFDDVAFYISTNVGEPMKPLVKVASGGELSRVMLALKTIFSKHQGITSIIFDEVDTGVSGRVAQAIAEKIAMVAMNSQVLCISHLPQVAAMADHHYLIQKEVTGERTRTSIQDVMAEDRTRELSRMLSGAEVTPLTLRHAEELLQLADARKTTLL